MSERPPALPSLQHERLARLFVPLNPPFESCGNRIVEDRQSEIDLLIAYRQGRGYAEHRTLARNARDVHRQPELQAHRGDCLAALIVGLARVPVLDDLHADQKAVAAHVAHAFMALHERLETSFEPLARLARPFRQAIAQDDLDDLEAD